MSDDNKKNLKFDNELDMSDLKDFDTVDVTSQDTGSSDDKDADLDANYSDSSAATDEFDEFDDSEDDVYVEEELIATMASVSPSATTFSNKRKSSKIGYIGAIAILLAGGAGYYAYSSGYFNSSYPSSSVVVSELKVVSENEVLQEEKDIVTKESLDIEDLWDMPQPEITENVNISADNSFDMLDGKTNSNFSMDTIPDPDMSDIPVLPDVNDDDIVDVMAEKDKEIIMDIS
jgi:hypothetical protein